MKVVSVSELKEHLSRYLRRIQQAGEIQIVNRGRPVARLVSMKGASRHDGERRERLIATGILRGGEGDVKSALPKAPIRISGLDLSGSLAEERGDRV